MSNGSIFTDDGVELRCVVSAYSPDSGVETPSDIATLTVNSGVINITSHPDNLAVTEPDGGWFIVEAEHSGGAPLFYEWQADVGDGWGQAWHVLSNAQRGNFPDFNVVSTIPEDTGQLRCRIRHTDINNTDGQIFSNTADLTVTAAEETAPDWHTPIPDTNKEDIDSAIRINLDNYCDNAISYTSMRAGEIEGREFVLDTHQLGVYECQILATGDGSALSNTFNCEILASQTSITIQPENMQAIIPEGDTNLCEATHPHGSVLYRWQGQLPGEEWKPLQNILSDVNRAYWPDVEITSTSYVDAELSPVTARCATYSYSIDGPENPSDEFLITIVEDDVVITTQPGDRYVTEPDGTTFTCIAEGVDLRYEWEAFSETNGLWLSPELVLSDVDTDSIEETVLVINSTSTEVVEGDAPTWSNVSNITIFDDQEANWERDMSSFVTPNGVITSWGTDAGTITEQGVFTPPAGQGIGQYQYTQTATNASGTSPSNQWTLNIIERPEGELPLINHPDEAMTYLGSFTLSGRGTGEGSQARASATTYNYFCMDNSGETMYLTGQFQTTQFGEYHVMSQWTVPDLGIEEDPADLPRAQQLQDWTNMLDWDKMPNHGVSPDATYNSSPIRNGFYNPDRLMGVYMREDGSLVVTVNVYYPAGPMTEPGDMMFVIEDPSDLENNDRIGYFRHDSFGAGQSESLLSHGNTSGGQIGQIPLEWQERFGGTHYFFSSANHNARDNRASRGPCMWVIPDINVWNRARMEAEEWDIDNDVERLLEYRYNGYETGSAPWPSTGYDPRAMNRDWYGMDENGEWNQQTYGAGWAFVPGSRTLIALGSMPHEVRICYKNTWDASGHTDTQCEFNTGGGESSCEPGYICSSGFKENDLSKWVHKYWLFDIDELLDARAQGLDPWTVKPYTHGELEGPYGLYPRESQYITAPLTAMHYCQATDRLFVAQSRAYRFSEHSDLCVWHAYDMGGLIRK